MNISLIGATGFVGTEVLNELTTRGHKVTALVRDLSRLNTKPQLDVKVVDIYDPKSVSMAINDQDAVISAFNPGWNEEDLYALFIKGSESIEHGVEQSNVKRLLVVGGAGSLYVESGIQLVDTPEFLSHVPANIIQGAKAARDSLNVLQLNTTLDWTFICPPAFLVSGERSGEYRVGEHDLLMDIEKPAGITVADLAVAIVDEIERPKHIRARFTVARPLAEI